MAFELKLPDIGEGVVEGEIVRWLVKEGDRVEQDQPLVEIMTDKATVEIPSQYGGKVIRCFGAEGEIVEVGSTLVVIETDEPVEEEKIEPPAAPLPAPAEAPRQGPAAAVLATPAVRKLARELGVNLPDIKGSGPAGRITPEDVQRAAAAPAGGGAVETIPYRGLRKKIGTHLAAAKRAAPHFTYVEEADVTELVRRREELAGSQPPTEVRLTYLPFIIKAVVEGLKKYPLLNAALDEEKAVIEVRKYYNIGIATATPEGLIVPVIKEADRKSILELAREINELTSATREGRVKVEDLRGGTFTITSLGPLGGLLATPILNYPEVAILGVHKISKRAVVREGEIVVRDMVNLSLSLDHRVVDGVVGAEFLRHLISLLETPAPFFKEMGQKS